MKLRYSVEDVSDYPERKMDFFTFAGECGVFRTEGGKIIGMIDGSQLKEKDKKHLRIEHFEVVETGKGYGTLCFELFLEQYPSVQTITGISLEESTFFWYKQGAMFYETCDYCDLNGEEDCPLVRRGEVCDEYSENEFVINLKRK